MLRNTVLDEQEPSVQSADRTKAVQVWSWGNMYLPKPEKWSSPHLYLKINSGFHARKNHKEQYLNVVTFSDASFSKKHIYLYDHAAEITRWTDHPVHEEVLIFGKNKACLF